MISRTACVILAAGRSRRFGSNKLLAPLADGSLLERALRACARFETVAVCSVESAPVARAFGATVIVNDRPELGMAHSLRLANECVDRDRSVAVLPADLLLIRSEHVDRIVGLHEESGAGVTFPVDERSVGGHPVVFSPEVRTRIAALCDGDTIRSLRDDAAFRRNPVLIREAWPYRDVDGESDLANP